MAFQILLNLLIAFVWMLLAGNWTFLDFGIGYVLGIVLLYALRGFFNKDFYGKKVWAAIVLLVIFIWEMILSNIAVIKQVISPKLKMKPGIIAVPIELTGPWEIVLLANLITLTPGTLSVDLSEDNSCIYVHAMDVPDAEEMIRSIKHTFERRIMEVFR